MPIAVLFWGDLSCWFVGTLFSVRKLPLCYSMSFRARKSLTQAPRVQIGKLRLRQEWALALVSVLSPLEP